MPSKTWILKLATCIAAGASILATSPAQAAVAHDGSTQTATAHAGKARTQAAGSGDPVVHRACTTGDAGASGGADIYNWHGPNSTLNVKLDLTDGKADGRYAAIRLLAVGMDGSQVQSHWNKVSGYGKRKEAWGPVKYKGGINHIGVQVATFKGSHMISYCIDFGEAD
ncbi:hypothetical protein [Streptomyces noursei]|uniref:hypothetical protein n=1 Tax=Streptomyces noursei TaxID=1971 RepID=UPI0019667A6C|nr:hypothetical protein [Streptomyces noursei]QRX94853.1 hypothetical protein JNO44_32065 [Streptomyces noursei]